MCCGVSHYFIIPYYIILYFIIPYFIYAFNIKLFLTDLRRIRKYIIRIQNTWVTRSMLNRERPSTVCLTHYTSMLIVISSRQTIASRSKDNQQFGYHSLHIFLVHKILRMILRVMHVAIICFQLSFGSLKFRICNIFYAKICNALILWMKIIIIIINYKTSVFEIYFAIVTTGSTNDISTVLASRPKIYLQYFQAHSC